MKGFGKRRKTGVLLIFTAVFLLVSFVFFEIRLVPLVRNSAKIASVNLAETAINEAVQEVLSEEGVTYEEIANITYNSQGEITSLSIDPVKINTLKSKISLRIAEKISGIDNEEIELPLGTILGMELFAGRGPTLKFYTSLSGNAITDFSSKFESAGINQTRHQIMIEVTSDIHIISSKGSAGKITVTTSVCAAETLIVGEVPSVYAGVDSSGTITQK